jgi:hypothetical protein
MNNSNKMVYGVEDILGEDTETFIAHVRHFFDKEGLKINIQDGAAILAEDPSNRFGLYNVAQNCKASPKTDWEKIIDEHFSINLSNRKANADLEFSEAKDLLRLRIYAKEDYGELTPLMVYREDLPDTYTTVVLEHPQSIATVNKDMVAKWKMSEEELFSIGLKNTLEKYSVNPTIMPFVDDTTVQFIFEDHFFAVTFLLDIEHIPHIKGKFGTLVAYPHRHAVLCQPINDLSILKLLKHLPVVILNQYNQNPGPISAKLFWYHNGKYTNLPYAVDGQSINFMPPQEFIDTLNQLS